MSMESIYTNTGTSTSTSTSTSASTSTGASTGEARPQVSFADEQLMLVDRDDRILGYASKVDAHRGAGVLHRAFSAFLFDDQRRLLLHRRSDKKPLWPGYWTNSCCSHPRRGEELEHAVHRRLREELGVTASVTPVYRFEYQATYSDLGSEHELCHVYLAHANGPVAIHAHADEVMEWCWQRPEQVDRLLRESPQELTPWFRLEWAALRGKYAQLLDAYLDAIENPRSVA